MKCSCLHFSLLKQMKSLVPSYNYMKWIKNLTKKKLNQLLLTSNKLKIMWLDHCKKWNLETHMTFVDVHLIEETTEYRFVLLKNYMGNNPSKFFLGRPQKNLEGFAWSFLSITGLRSQRQFAPKCSFLASRPLGHCYFRISWQIP